MTSNPSAMSREAEAERAAGVIWNDRDARMGGPWGDVPEGSVARIQTLATARAALAAAATLRSHLATAGGKPGEGDIFAAFRKLVGDLDGLIADSEGVAGLHRNGDVATWEELVSGGRFEDWLSSLDAARAALSSLSKPSEACPHPSVYDAGECCGGKCPAFVPVNSEAERAGWRGGRRIQTAPKDKPILVHGGASHHGGSTYGFRVLTISEERHLFAADGGSFPWTPTRYWDLPELPSAPTSPSESSGEEA